MIERIVAWALFTTILAAVLKLLSLLIGFDNTAIIALAGIAVLAIDSRR